MASPKDGATASGVTALRLLITRPATVAAAWAEALESRGARPIIYPTIETVAAKDLGELDRRLGQLTSYTGVIFTSATAVDITGGRPGFPASAPGDTIVIAVGAATDAALRARGWAPTLVPKEQRQEGILKELPPTLTGQRFLFPQAAIGRELLAQELRARGAEVDVVPIYDTVPLRPLPTLPAFDVALFASPSALHSFADAHGIGTLASRPFVVLGPTTASTARRLGLAPAAEAQEPSLDGLFVALASLAASRDRQR